MSEAQPAAAKVLHVLFAFSLSNPRPSAAELAEATGLNRTTTHRMLQLLEEQGMVRRSIAEPSRYELAARVLQLSEVFLHQLDDLRSVAMSYLTTLRDETGETAALHMRQGGSRVGIVQVESPHQLRRTYSDLGRPVPLYLGAPSLAMLAFLSPEQIERYIPPADQPWPDIAASDSDELYGWLEQTRDRGYVISHAHRLAGIVSIAAPIRSRGGDAIASINVTGPTDRFTAERSDMMIRAVVTAAHSISAHVGYTDPLPDLGLRTDHLTPPTRTKTAPPTSID